LFKIDTILFSPILMENRIRRFQDLHNNKWFHVMNLTVEIIKTSDKRQKVMLAKWGAGFFY